jgi:carbon-monoxide dehydrogenase medium subunit
MFPAPFDYRRAASLQEALDLLRANPGARLLAGGHSLVPMMRLRLAQPPAVVDIGRVPELRGIDRSGPAIRIGATTTHREIERSEMLRAACPLLPEVASKIADPQVRSWGTIGGNVAHADPGSDLPGALVALGATVHVAGPDGTRAVPAARFFLDLLTTDIRAGEIVTHVVVPALAAGTGTAYAKVEHPASGYAVCAAAAVVALDAAGTCTAVSLCFNGVTATPLDASATAAALAGTRMDDGAIARAMGRLEVPDPLGDVHFSGEYRAALARVHGGRALAAARDRARASRS